MKLKSRNLIKKAGFIVLSCSICLATYSQVKEKSVKKLYLQLAGGIASHKGDFSEAGIQAILKNNWTATFSYHDIEMNPKNLPADYQEGYIVLIVLPIPEGYPTTKMKLYSFTGGKCFQKNRKIWFTTEAGISIVHGEKFIFTPCAVTHDFFYISPNYSFTKENKTSLGGMLKVDFNWAVLPCLGLGAGAFANFNAIQSPVGFQLKLICGWLNRKSKL